MYEKDDIRDWTNDFDDVFNLGASAVKAVGDPLSDITECGLQSKWGEDKVDEKGRNDGEKTGERSLAPVADHFHDKPDEYGDCVNREPPQEPTTRRFPFRLFQFGFQSCLPYPS
jgi:hypothetical protein